MSTRHKICSSCGQHLYYHCFMCMYAVTSFSNLLDDTSENIYENYAVIASQGVAGTPVEDVDSTWHDFIATRRMSPFLTRIMSVCHAGPPDPVLINDKLARGFAKAWSVGSEQKEVKCMEFVIIILLQVTFHTFAR